MASPGLTPADHALVNALMILSGPMVEPEWRKIAKRELAMVLPQVSRANPRLSQLIDEASRFLSADGRDGADHRQTAASALFRAHVALAEFAKWRLGGALADLERKTGAA